MKLLVALSILAALVLAADCGAAQEASSAAATTEPEDRFQIAVHNFVRDRKDVEVYIRLNRLTGRTFRLNTTGAMRWQPIPEQKDGETLEVGDTPRYELCCHNITRGGKDLEVFLRFDRQTGKTWSWSGTEPSWMAVEED